MTTLAYRLLVAGFVMLAGFGLVLVVLGALEWMQPTLELECSEVTGREDYPHSGRQKVHLHGCELDIADARLRPSSVLFNVNPTAGPKVWWKTVDEELYLEARRARNYEGGEAFRDHAAARYLARQPGARPAAVVDIEGWVERDFAVGGVTISEAGPSVGMSMIGLLLLLLGMLLASLLMRKQRAWMQIQRDWERQQGIIVEGARPAAF